MATPYIRHVHSDAEMTTVLEENPAVVVAFQATWSAPCREMAPFYSQLAAKHRAPTFVRVEIGPDNIQSVGQKYRLTALPTFIMIRNEAEIDRVRGPDRKGLKEMIAQHAPNAQATVIANGSGSADASDASDTSLLEYLNMAQVNCLNEARGHTLKSIVEKKRRNITQAYLESDDDEQLLINLPFNQAVRVRSIILHAKRPNFGPKDIKIFINNPTVGFDDVESATEPAVVQALELSEDVVKEGEPIQLRFVRLQHVDSLHIFIGSNHGYEDFTRIDAIDVYGPRFGEPVGATQMRGLRDYEGTHQLGIDLLTLFRRVGGLQNLSNAVSFFRESAILCPSGSRIRSRIIGNLGVALSTQYQQQGDYSDLMETITVYHEMLEAHPPGHPSRDSSLNNLSGALLTRYNREGDLTDLSVATEYYREALELRPPGHPNRATTLFNLSNALLTRYHREGSLTGLSAAIEYYQEAVKLCPPGHPSRASSLTNLSNALTTRYRHEGGIADLSTATEYLLEALELRPPGHPERDTSLSNLSNALMARYEHEGGLTNLSMAIECYREALEICHPGHPNRATSLVNLSTALLTRYRHEGALSELSTAIGYYQEGLELRPPGHPDRASSLSNLSDALLTRFEREGGLSDLSSATEYYQEALELRPPGHPNRASSFNNLSNALLTRYRREGGLTDLSTAIKYYQQGLELRPPGHPDRALSLNSLSDALLTRYRREGGLSDLSTAIQYYQEGLELRPAGHPGRALGLNSLSNALTIRYQYEGGLSDLSAATEYHREALKLCPLDHPDRAWLLLSLSCTLLQTPHLQDNPILVQQVLDMLSSAVDLPNCPPDHRLRAALHWVNAAYKLAQESVLDAYKAAMEQLDIVLATSSTLEYKRTQLSSKELTQRNRLGVEAASCAVLQGEMILAVEFLERGRNLLFAQIGQYRVEVEALREVDEELAKRFTDLSSLLESSVVSNAAIAEGRSAFEDPIERYRRGTSDWNQAVNDIRAVEGFERFLRAPEYRELRSAADEGPIIMIIPGDGQSDALIVLKDRDKPFHVNLPAADPTELVELYISLAHAVDDDDERSTEKVVKKILGSLWDLVIRPITEVLENELHVPLHSRIWWCPTGLLSLLPLHAAGHYTRKQDTNQNLPDRYVSSYTPTLRALVRAQRNRNVGEEKTMLIVTQPDTPGQEPLLNAPEEAKLVKESTGAKMGTTLLSGKEGTHTAVLDGMVGHSWLHLVCHGIQSSENPFHSCFYLYDKKLTLHDIIQRGLPDAEFAFLAACHTATGDLELWDEGLHLAAGLQFAGFKSVVGTIWKVADKDGPLVAAAFYKALELERRDCTRAAYALSEAVRQLRVSGVPVNRWMRYVHIGI